MRKSNLSGAVSLAALAFGMIAANAAENVTISKSASQNVVFADGVFTPTGDNAALNVGDLENALASGAVAVATGSTGNQAGYITVDAPLSWTSSTGLTLDAYRSIIVKKPVSDSGSGALTLKTNDKGSAGILSFIGNGSIGFLSTTNALTINGQAYSLENSLSSLAAAIAQDPSGSYALANNYDAKADGVYANTPIATLGGTLEGLGNAITNFSLHNDTRRVFTALIGTNAGTVSDLILDRMDISELAKGTDIGGLIGLNRGALFGDHVTGKIVGAAHAFMGGLVGFSTGVIARSSSSATVSGQKGGNVGGLVGINSDAGIISQSFATGGVHLSNGFANVGGLVGNSGGEPVLDSYATGAVNGNRQALVGGFAGDEGAGAQRSYSTGSVTIYDTGRSGGFAGSVYDSHFLINCVWDIDTSGTNQGTGQGNVDGLTGLTDDQLKSGLPSGFDPAVWAQDSKINSGYPYLIANPPPK